MGCSKSLGVSLALSQSSSMNDWGPKEEYAVMTMFSDLANWTSSSWER